MKTCVLTVAEMALVDRLTIERGTPGVELMRNAGRAGAAAVIRHFGKVNTLVLCGPGNNGGDGFVIAKVLEEEGWAVTVSLLVSPDKLSGDAKLAYEDWIQGARTPVLAPFNESLVGTAELIIDAVFGTGLARQVGSPVMEIIAAANAGTAPVVSVDIASGVKGDDGQILGCAFDASLTVTFFRKKPGHLLFPGRQKSGETEVADIGIQDDSLQNLSPQTGENDPEAWLANFPWPKLESHKYDRGHTIVVSGGVSATGAARLAAMAALRSGSGLVTVASPASAVLVNASQLTSVMVRGFGDLDGFADIVKDTRLNAFVIGPGNGVGEATRVRVLHLLSLRRSIVLDADALTSFAEDPAELFGALHEKAVLTPHAGEFDRLFPDLKGVSRIEAARGAASRTGAVLVLKGPDTIIARPDGRLLINANAPATLATAGSGDVLAGLIAGLMAQGMDGFDAASAGVWIHGEAASLFGPGLISEDLPDIVPDVLDTLLNLQTGAVKHTEQNLDV